jgi:hypothetical protein
MTILWFNRFMFFANCMYTRSRCWRLPEHCEWLRCLYCVIIYLSGMHDVSRVWITGWLIVERMCWRLVDMLFLFCSIEL